MISIHFCELLPKNTTFDFPLMWALAKNTTDKIHLHYLFFKFSFLNWKKQISQSVNISFKSTDHEIVITIKTKKTFHFDKPTWTVMMNIPIRGPTWMDAWNMRWSDSVRIHWTGFDVVVFYTPESPINFIHIWVLRRLSLRPRLWRSVYLSISLFCLFFISD